jgi:RHS repeat-associated protein
LSANQGWVAYDDVRLTAVTPNATIRRRTYLLGGQPVAGENVKNGLFYMHSDHLGSNSVMSYGQGHGNVGTAVPNSRGRYFPYGGWRVTPTAGLTDQGYTGHKHNNLGSTADDLGLIFMNARYYLPSAGRFISADTIVPDPTNPQQFNRYTYVLNNPLRFRDATGRCAGNEADAAGTPGRDDECWTYVQNDFCDGLQCGANDWRSWIIIGADSLWTKSQLEQLREAVLTARNALLRAGVEDWREAVGTQLRFSHRNVQEYNAFFWVRGNDYSIELLSGIFSQESTIYSLFVILHEIGHAIDYQVNGLALFAGQTLGAAPLAPTSCFRDYACNSPVEGWADAFAVYAVTSGSPYGMLTVDGAALLNGYPYQGAAVLEFRHVSSNETTTISNQVQQQLRTYLGK